MAIWGMGVMVGPILGPTLGGYLTELYNWRWVFFVNLPFGIAGDAGHGAFLPRDERASGMKFDWFGFAVLGHGHGRPAADAGPRRDEGLVRLDRDHHRGGAGGLGLYLFVVHMLTAQKPFITPRMFKDRNFVGGVCW